MDVKHLMLIFSAMIIPACATTSDAPQSPEKSTAQSNGLLPRTLVDGDCGLFVWTGDAQKKFVLFSKSQNKSASWLSPNGEVSLTSKDRRGDATQGQFPSQVFISEKYGELHLNLRDPQPISDGTRYRAGTLTGDSEEGWSRVTSVVGLSVCTPVN